MSPKIAIAVPRWNVEATAECYPEMGEVPADSNLLVDLVGRRPGWPHLGVAEAQPAMNVIAYRLDLGVPSGESIQTRPS